MKTLSMKVIDNKLYMGDVSLTYLANKYKTPLIVYDEAGIRKKIDDYLKGLDNENVNGALCYASKAFIAPYLCDILKDKGCYIDAVSIGDLYLMNKASFPMSHIILHGNNKSIDDLEYAIDNNVGLIVCDNLEELHRLNKLCDAKEKEVNTLFRINPGVEAHTHKYIQTSKLDSKFGESIFDSDTIDAIMKFYKNSKYLRLCGFHAHIGSQITSNESFIVLVKVISSFLKDILDKYQYTPDIIDLGGGIAIKYLDSDNEPDITSIVKEMVEVLLENLKENGISIKKVFVEPGRSIVGDNGITLYKVGAIKHTYANTNYVFIDGGMADNIRPALYEAKYTVDNASCFDGKIENREFNNYNVSGKCCESGDFIVKNYPMYKPNVDDILCVYSTGAYCYSMSMNYNGLLRPACIFINKDKEKLVIKRETLEELVSTCVFE